MVYNGDYLTLLNIKYKSSWPHGFREEDVYVYSIVRGWSCEPNNQLNVCTTSVTEGEVAGVKLV